MGKLLLDESPLLVLPSLALKVGLERAVILQQIHYLSINDGSVTKTPGSWKEVFPFIPERTLERHFQSLQDEGFLTAIREGKGYRRKYILNFEALADRSVKTQFDPSIQAGSAKMAEVSASPSIYKKEEEDLNSSPNSGSQVLPKAEKPAPDPRVRQFQGIWGRRYFAYWGFSDRTPQAFIGKQIKALPSEYTIDVLQRAMEEFYLHPDPWVKDKLGITFRGFMHQLEKLVQVVNKQKAQPQVSRLLKDRQHD